MADLICARSCVARLSDMTADAAFLARRERDADLDQLSSFRIQWPSGTDSSSERMIRLPDFGKVLEESAILFRELAHESKSELFYIQSL